MFDDVWLHKKQNKKTDIFVLTALYNTDPNM